tara:strand:+ start:43 stop:192 length:150 start_codon:yes stop_codon:yes gene_type:complete
MLVEKSFGSSLVVNAMDFGVLQSWMLGDHTNYIVLIVEIERIILCFMNN